MGLINRLNIASRIAVGFGCLLLASALMSGLALLALQRTGTAVRQIVEEDWSKASAAATIDTMTRANARRTMELFFVDPAGAVRVRERIARNREVVDQAWRRSTAWWCFPRGGRCWPA